VPVHKNVQLAPIMHQSYFNSIHSSLILSNQPMYRFLLQTYIICIFNFKKTVISVCHIALLMLPPLVSIMWCLLGPSRLVQCSRLVFRKYPFWISGHELSWQTFLLFSSCPPVVGMVAWLGHDYFFSTCFPIHNSPFIHPFNII